MALKTCSDCGIEHSDSAVACPKCGSRPRKSRKWLYAIPISLALFLAFGAILPEKTPLLDSSYREKNSTTEPSREMQKLIDHAKADQCWEDAKKQPLQKLAMLHAECKALEQEYVRKYNTAF